MLEKFKQMEVNYVQFFYYHFNRIDLIFICEVFSLQITDQEIVVELGLFGADYLSHQSSTFAQI